MHVEVPEIHTGQEEVFPVSGNRFRGRIVCPDENDRCEWSDAEGNAHLEGRLTEAGRRDGGRPPAKPRSPVPAPEAPGASRPDSRKRGRCHGNAAVPTLRPEPAGYNNARHVRHPGTETA